MISPTTASTTTYGLKTPRSIKLHIHKPSCNQTQHIIMSSIWTLTPQPHNPKKLALFLALPILWRFSRQLVSNSCTAWTAGRLALLSIEFSRQEYWSGLPFHSPGDLPDPGIQPGSPTLQTDSLGLSHQGSPINSVSILRLKSFLNISPLSKLQCFTEWGGGKDRAFSTSHLWPLWFYPVFQMHISSTLSYLLWGWGMKMMVSHT